MGKVKPQIPMKQYGSIKRVKKSAENFSDKRPESCIIGIASPSPAGNGTEMYSVRTQVVVEDQRNVGAEYHTQDMR